MIFYIFPIEEIKTMSVLKKNFYKNTFPNLYLSLKSVFFYDFL